MQIKSNPYIINNSVLKHSLFQIVYSIDDGIFLLTMRIKCNTAAGINVLRVLFLIVLITQADLKQGFTQQTKGYKINIHIDGAPDTVFYLANYYGDKTYLTDTAFVSAPGQFVFIGDSILPGGIYILAGQSNNKYFELIIDKDQNFAVETSIKGIPGQLNFEGSAENSLFYHYVNENIRIRTRIDELRLEKQLAVAENLSPQNQDELIDSLFHVLYNLENNVILDNPDSFVSTILKAKQEPEAAPVRYLESGAVDSVYAYQYYKKHYWDNLDPADERLLRTPLYHKLLQNYFEKVVYQHPDTIILEADLFVERASKNKETYKYAIWYLTYKFETTKIMGFDEVFVHMVDNYYSKGLAYWADSSIVTTLANRAEELRNVLIGNPGQNMILIDTAGSFKSLYAMDGNYTLVLFYEMGCSHCRKEIAQLRAWYPDNIYDLKVFAVCTDTSLVEWKEFVRKEALDWVHVNGTRSVTPNYHKLYDISMTPTLYLLDNKKTIIAKRLKAEQLFPFLENYEKRKKD